MSYLWAIIASTLAVGLEAAYRGSGRSWLAMLPFTLIPILFLQYALWQIQQGAESLLTATLLFGAFTALIRIIVVLGILQEHVSWKMWLVFSLLSAVTLIKGVLR